MAMHQDIAQDVEVFEGLLDSALDYWAAPDRLNHWHWRLPLRQLVLDYRVSGVFPEERLSKFVDYLMDLKLQIYFVQTSWVQLVNWVPPPSGVGPTILGETRRAFLARMALDQALIGQVRIVWERLFNAVYYVEVGHDLDAKRSKKARFFRAIRNIPRWQPLLQAEALLEDYDNRFRTPEFHRSSNIRANILRQRFFSPLDLLEPMNPAMQIVPETIMSAVRGQ
jgi:hypothetical protein